MRVGLVRNVGLGMVALVAVGLAGCDDPATDFSVDETVDIFTNPSAMTIPAGVTTLLEARTENQGDAPTWEEIEASIDATCGSATLTIAEAASYVPEVQPPGQFDVTGGTTIGTTCITLSGGGVTETVDVTVVGDSLAILNLPAGDLAPGDTINLSASLLSADGSAVGPFDPLTDVVWSVDDASVATIDANGQLAALGAGSVQVTATWTGGGITVTSTEVITVAAPPPTGLSADVGSADDGQLITITGTGMIPSAHLIFVDGFELDPILEPMVVNSTTATFRMPPGADGDVEVTIGVPGDVSDPVTVTRTGSTEPDDDDTATAPTVTLPADEWGFVTGADVDFYQFTLTGDTTFDLFLDWSTGEDLDLYVTDAGFNFALCGFAAGTSNQPEMGQCTLGAGTYWFAVISYSGGDGTYHMVVTEVP